MRIGFGAWRRLFHMRQTMTLAIIGTGITLILAAIPACTAANSGAGSVVMYIGHGVAIVMVVGLLYALLRVQALLLARRMVDFPDDGPIGMLLLSSRGKPRAMNGMLSRRLGYDTPAQAVKEWVPDSAWILSLRETVGQEVSSPLRDVLLPHRNGGNVRFHGCCRGSEDDILVFLCDASAEEQLQRVQHAYRELFESLDIGVIYFDQELRYIEINAAAEMIVHTSREALRGKTPAEAFPTVATGAFSRVHARVCAGEGPVRVEQSVYHTGWTESRWLAGNYYPRRNADGEIIGVTGLVRDVTEWKKLEQECREANRRFREMLLIINQVAITCDARGAITFCNEYFLSLTGWHADELLGHNFLDRLVPGEHGEAFRASLQTFLRGQNSPMFHLTFPVRDRQGRCHHLFWNTIMLYDTHGKFAGVAAIGERAGVREHEQERPTGPRPEMRHSTRA